MATVPHQRHEPRARGVGSEVGRVLAQEPNGFTFTPPLFDRRSQRADWRSQILFIQPCAWRTKSGHGKMRLAPLVAASRIRALVHRKLLSGSQRRTGDGSLPSPRLALRTSAFLCHTAESSVLRASTSRIRPVAGRASGSAYGGASPQCHECLAGRGRPIAILSAATLSRRTRRSGILPATQLAVACVTYENQKRVAARIRNRRHSDQVLHHR